MRLFGGEWTVVQAGDDLYSHTDQPAFSRSALAGIAFSAIIFGASHGYEGGPRMVLIAIFGLLFGLLAWWRKSLRPGMIAHAWHDAFSGAVLHMLK